MRKLYDVSVSAVQAEETYWSFAICFMPSSKTPVTLVLRYFLAEWPCGGASDGMVKPGSGCAEAARELPGSWPLRFLLGVPVRGGGAGLAALLVAGKFVMGGTGDCSDSRVSGRAICLNSRTVERGRRKEALGGSYCSVL
jgi:hypothetical protein